MWPGLLIHSASWRDCKLSSAMQQVKICLQLATIKVHWRDHWGPEKQYHILFNPHTVVKKLPLNPVVRGPDCFELNVILYHVKDFYRSLSIPVEWRFSSLRGPCRPRTTGWGLIMQKIESGLPTNSQTNLVWQLNSPGTYRYTCTGINTLQWTIFSWSFVCVKTPQSSPVHWGL